MREWHNDPFIAMLPATIFSSIQVLVIGDVMLDRYWLGLVQRISPEAPIPILNFESSNAKPGGASNVAHNIVHLGANCTLIGAVGKDSDGNLLCSDLISKKVTCKILKSRKFKTKAGCFFKTAKQL